MKNDFPKPDVLFLDIGGVLLSNGWGTESRIKAAEEFGFDFEVMNKRHNLVFNLFESGKISLDDYLETAVFYEPRNFTVEQFKQFMFAQSRSLPDMLNWIIDWKKKTGIRIISINNEGKELNTYRIHTFGLTKCFDAFLSSCDVGMSKPNPAFFDLAIAVAHAPAANCLYFDDTLVHVETARKKGINAFQHKNFEETSRILEQLKLESNA